MSWPTWPPSGNQKKIYQSLGDSKLWGFDDRIFVVTYNGSWENGTVVCLKNTVSL
jgi:hypothetical protein